MPRDSAREATHEIAHETPYEVLKSLRALREEMRQSLMEVPEYRMLAALDRSIEEISAIMRITPEQEPARAAPTQRAEPEAAVEAPRGPSVAAAFADNLAARLERRPTRVFSTAQALRG